MLKKFARLFVNAGSRLHKKKLFGFAKILWGLPGVMKYSSPVNIKKYLALLSDKKFEVYVEKHYFRILTDDGLFAWVETQVARRKLGKLQYVINKSIVADPLFALNRLVTLYSTKQFAEANDKSKLAKLDSLCAMATDDQKLILAVIFADGGCLPYGYKTHMEESFLMLALQYYRVVQLKAPDFILQAIDGCTKSMSAALNYSYCQYQQVCGSLDDSIIYWGRYIECYPADVRAKQNYLIQLAKADDSRLVDVMLELEALGGLTDRFIDTAFKAVNRINDVDLLVRASSIKKKLSMQIG